MCCSKHSNPSVDHGVNVWWKEENVVSNTGIHAKSAPLQETKSGILAEVVFGVYNCHGTPWPHLACIQFTSEN